MEVPYLESGYIDIEKIRSMTKATPFVFILGSRQGAGKTYGVTKSIIQHEETPVIVRRTKEERTKFANEKLSPFVRIDKSIIGVNESAFTILYHKDSAAENGLGDVFGYVIDLSTASKRGFALDGFDSVFFDECVPERYAGGKADVTQAETFFNLLITLFGEDAKFKDISTHPKVWIIGNANNIDCGVFRVFGVTKTIERMIAKGKTAYVSPQRALSIFLAEAPENAERRQKMPLMRVAEKSEVKDMALQNKFIFDKTGIKRWPLREFQALACFADEYRAYTVWIHKREYKPFLYITRGKFPAKHEMANSKEAFTNLCRSTAFKSKREFWNMALNANSGTSCFYDSVQSKQWFMQIRKP